MRYIGMSGLLSRQDLPPNSLLEICETNGAVSRQSVLHSILTVDPRTKLKTANLTG